MRPATSHATVLVHHPAVELQHAIVLLQPDARHGLTPRVARENRQRMLPLMTRRRPWVGLHNHNCMHHVAHSPQDPPTPIVALRRAVKPFLSWEQQGAQFLPAGIETLR